MEAVMRFGTVIAALTVLILMSTQPALAAGGGGGGGSSGGISSGPSVNVSKLYEESLAHLQAGENEDAERKLKKVLGAIPENAQANYMMALAKSGQGEDKSSVRYYKKAIKYDRHMYTAYVTLGQTYMGLGEAADAQKLLKKLEKVKSKCKDKCDMGHLDTAHADLTAVVNGTTDAPGDQSSLLFDRIADPDSAYLGAVALINGGEFEAAIIELTKLLEAIGPHADVLNYLGYTHRKMGYFDDAYGYYKQALAADPNHRGAHEYLGELYIQTGQRKKAARQLDKLAELCPFGCAEFDDLEFKFNSTMQAAD